MKNIIVTGASKGIGKELVIQFLEKGHKVYAISRNIEAMEQISKQKNYSFHACDISKTENLKVALQDLPFEEIDILINNAGFLINKPFVSLTEEDFIQSLKVQYLGPVALIQRLESRFNKNAHIVNISTMGAVQGSSKFPGLAAYGGSKAALCHLTEILAEEWKDREISINALALGAVQTEMLESAFPGYKAPLSAAEMARYIVNFALEGNKYFNGKILPVSSTTP